MTVQKTSFVFSGFSAMTYVTSQDGAGELAGVTPPFQDPQSPPINSFWRMDVQSGTVKDSKPMPFHNPVLNAMYYDANSEAIWLQASQQGSGLCLYGINATTGSVFSKTPQDGSTIVRFLMDLIPPNPQSIYNPPPFSH